jgi:hypothetical protein
VSALTAGAIAEAAAMLRRPSIDAAAVAVSPAFMPWFGRGQQYLSFSRR